MKHIVTVLKYIVAVAVMVIAHSCLKDDIPYPHIQPNFLTIEAEGQERAASIDTINRKVMFYLPEEVDITKVKIASYTLSDGATAVGDTLDRPLDLSQSQTATLHLYYDYQWTLEASQTIERYFTVNGQIGQSVIDVPGRRVVAYVGQNADLKNIVVESIKLGPAGSTISPDIQAGQTIDFSTPLDVTLTVYGEQQLWTIYIDTTDAAVTTERVDAWTSAAWVYGSAEAGADNSVEYRLKGEEQWTRVPDSWITTNGGSFTARLLHLKPQTEYEARAISGEDKGATIAFTTDGEQQLENASFDNWWLDGKVWNPWSEGGTSFWDTGNKGATTLGPSNTTPTEDTPTGKGYAAQLETKFVGIGMLGKLAAGNIFYGSYVRTDGTNGVLSFGRDFSLRPTKLKGYMKYTTAPISSVTAGFENIKGQPDTCIIWVALIDSPSPFEIRTNPNNRQLFDPEASYVVAYGKMEYAQTITKYVPFEFELNYKATNRIPRYILVTASASKYGDYFTGGNGAVLWIDDLELEYDY